MQQMNVFPVMNVQSEDQKMAAKDVAVIVNILGMKVIEIEQCNPRVGRIEGIQICKYREVARSEEQLMEAGGNIDQKERYPNEIVGGSLLFVDNPFVRPPVAGGTGRVAFLLDDNEALPPESLSGERTGWNREFLASHWDEKLFFIVDDTIRAEVAKRAAAIKVAIKKQMEAPESDAPEAALPAFAQERPEEVSDVGVGRVVEEGAAGGMEKVLAGSESQAQPDTALAEENAKLREELAQMKADKAAEEQAADAEKPRRGRPPKAKKASTRAEFAK